MFGALKHFIQSKYQQMDASQSDKQNEVLMESLIAENKRLKQENADLRLMVSVVKENHQLRMQLSHVTSSSDSHAEQSAYFTGDKDNIKSITNLDDSKFMGSFKARPVRTSSRIDTSTSASGSACMRSEEKTDECHDRDDQSSQALPDGMANQGLERVLGEIAFQLDRRMLSHIFQDQDRLYGFTVRNIPDKVIQMTTNHDTGEVNKLRRLLLTKRHRGLMDDLHCLGYNQSIHPAFSELMINTYGVLRQRPDPLMARILGFNNSSLLRRVVINVSPACMVRDMLVLLSCLCFMSRKDGKPIFLS